MTTEQVKAKMRHEIDIEVRYYETDGQGIVHHSNYFQYFELARVKMLQSAGYKYEDLEEQGHFLVVHSIKCRYLLPAKFGDTLRIVTEIERVTSARIDHCYQVFRHQDLLAKGSSTIACIDRNGMIQRIPEILIQEYSE